MEPPGHVVAAFSVPTGRGEPLIADDDRVWRFGDVVLKRSADPVVSAWVASVLESLRIADLRVPRPVRALDGRWAVGGWSAERFLVGRPEPRFDEMIAVSQKLHLALRGIPRPKFLDDHADLRYRLDAMAWGEVVDSEGFLGSGAIAQRWRSLAAGRTPLALRQQVVHGELIGHVLFAGSAPPAVVDPFPMFRPTDYPAAILTVDAIAWGGADPSLAERWGYLSGWQQLLRRAVMYRLALTTTHPRATPQAVVGIMTAANLLFPDR